MGTTKFFIKLVGVPNYEEMIRYPAFSKNIENNKPVFDLIKSIEPDDRFVLYVKGSGNGFVGILCVKERAVFNASPNDPNYLNSDYPHYIEVKEAEVLSQKDGLKISVVKKWNGHSDELKKKLRGNLQGVGGIHQISARDFDWFEHKIDRQLSKYGGI